MTPAISLRTTLLLLIVILAGCGGGSDSSTNAVTNPPEPPQDGLSGKVSSKIAGGQISVTDASGQEIVVASGRNTGADGQYNLVFSEFAINAGINPPLLVTLDGSGATAVCDFNREGDNDCISQDGSFVSFGETYTLPDNYILRGMAQTFPPEDTPGDRVVVVNLSAASDLASEFALNASTGGDLSAADVVLAEKRALGTVEFVTGLSTNGKAMNDITIADLTTGTITNSDSLALALFGASLHGQVSTESVNTASYQQILRRLKVNLKPVTTSAGDQLRSTGQFLAENVAAYLILGTSYQNGLATASPVLSGSLSSQAAILPLLEQTAGNPVFIALPADPSGSGALDRAKTLTARLSEAMGATLLISATPAYGGTASGAATVFEDQLTLIETLVATEIRNTLLQLDSAIAKALVDNETQLTGTNVSGVLAFEGTTVSMTTATSTSSNIQTGISVNVSIPTGTRNNPGGAGTFNASEISISVLQTQDDLTTQQIYNGALVLTMVATGPSADAAALAYSGSLRATSGLEFIGDINVDDMSASTESSPRGSYAASFTFDDGAILMMNGQLQTQVDLYTVITGESTISTDLQTNVITDMNANLNLSLDGNGEVTGGVIDVSGTQAATMDANGIINYTDGTATSLPAPVI